MESMKDKVAIIGMGCTKFGELWDKSCEDLPIDASYEAFEDAGIDPKDIQAAWLGCMFLRTGIRLSYPLKLQYLPVSHVENACGTGHEALRNAAFAVAAKAYDLVLVCGFEKLKDWGFGGFPATTESAEKVHPVYGFESTGVARYALAATRYFSQYGLSPEEGKRMLAKVSVKSHHNGFLNPRAHLRFEVTEEQVLSAPMIAWPLGLYDCCGMTDGGTAAIICRAEDAKKYKPNGDYILIKGLGLSSGPNEGKITTRYDWAHWEETVRAAQQAYQDAGIKDPKKEIDMCEVHDCFSIAEVMCYEDLGFCEKGKARHDIEAGELTLEGKHPFNVGGGLKSFGHPIGASGLREIYEIYVEILGKAQLPERQLKNIKMGLSK